MICQNHEKYTTKPSVKISQDAVYWVNLGKRHKRKDYDSGRHGLMPLSFMTQCQLIASKKVVSFRGAICVSKDSYAASRTLGRWCKAKYQAARDRLRRETSSTLTSGFKRFHKMQYLKIKEDDQDSRVGKNA